MEELGKIKNKFQKYLQQRVQKGYATPVSSNRDILNKASIQKQIATDMRSFDSSDSNLYKGFLNTPSSRHTLSNLKNNTQETTKTHSCKVVKGSFKTKKCQNFDQNTCSICLDLINIECQMSCQHKFCKQCLQEWLQHSSKCPYCRKQCDFYFNKTNGKYTIIQHRKYGEQMDQEQYQDLEFNCYVCMNATVGDNLLICDACDGYYCHLLCDQSLNGLMPADEQYWECHQCRNR